MASSSRAQVAKEKGNEAFKKGQYAEAVGLYTDAILCDSSNSTYPLNRSMAYLKLGKFEDAERDATTSIRLDPANVKAYYRRGSARRHMTRLEDAIADFEKVLHLDAQNKDAKAEISALNKELVDEDRRRKERRQPPLDLDTEARKKESKGGTPGGEEGGSSVEAARRFLEQVGMDGNAPTQKPNSKSATSDEVLPPRFPGETGGMLREVSTRKLERTQGSPATATGQISSSVDTESLQVVDSSTKSVDATETSNEATIASLNALSSLGPPKKSSASAAAAAAASAATPLRPPTVNSVVKRRLNAYDFHRAWREVSAGSSQDIFDLLSSLDLEALPQTLGSLLEPDLLVSLLAGLTSISTKQQDGSEVQHTNVVGTVMRVLPSCDRFETALMFLSPSEKDVASTILDSLRRNKYPSIESIGKRWSF